MESSKRTDIKKGFQIHTLLEIEMWRKFKVDIFKSGKNLLEDLRYRDHDDIYFDELGRYSIILNLYATSNIVSKYVKKNYYLNKKKLAILSL